LEHDGTHAARRTRGVGHGNGRAEQQQSATEHGIPPGRTVPPTVLVTELDNGSLILQGRPEGPRVWLGPAEAAPLKQELVAAFGRTRLAAPGDDQDQAR
jgi:hypothetical protein